MELQSRTHLATHDINQLSEVSNDHAKIEHVRLADGAHAHSAYAVPHDPTRIMVPDLGLDLVIQYSLDAEKGTLTPLPAQPYVTIDARHITPRHGSSDTSTREQQHRAGTTAMGRR